MKDPRRLLDGDGSEEQRALLRAGASEEPPADGSARVLAALGITAPAVPVSDGGGLESTSSSASTASGGLASGGGAGAAGVIKVVVALGTLAVLGAGAMLWSRNSAEPAHVEPPASVSPIARTNTNAKPDDVQPASNAQPAGSVALEIAALERARAQLARKDGQAALAALREYAREHPAGVLAQEADVLRVEALLLAGERKAASDLAQRLLQQRADTPHRARLQGLLQQASAQPEP